MSVASVKRLWPAISLPRSHVSDLYSSWGSLRAFLINASMTVSVSLLATLASKDVARLALHQRGDLAIVSTEHQIAFPVPGTARSSTDAGRSLIDTVSTIRP